MKYKTHNLDNIIEAIEEYENTGSTCMEVCGKYDVEKNTFFYYLKKYRMENNSRLTNHQLGGGKLKINKKMTNRKTTQILSNGGNINGSIGIQPTINDILNNNILLNNKQNHKMESSEINKRTQSRTREHINGIESKQMLNINEEGTKYKEVIMPTNTPIQRKIIAEAKKIPLEEYEESLRERESEIIEEKKKLKNKKNAPIEDVKKHKEKEIINDLNQYRLSRPELGIF